MLKRVTCLGLSLAWLWIGTSAQVVGQTTGSRVGTGMQKKTIIWFSDSHEITTIRRLLQEGEGERAVHLARKYADSLAAYNEGDGQLQLYFAQNALCAAQTTTGDMGGAIETCTAAADLIPSRWQAYNNRGTAYYMSGEYRRALDDYETALEKLSEKDPARPIVDGNIDLAKGRMAATSR